MGSTSFQSAQAVSGSGQISDDLTSSDKECGFCHSHVPAGATTCAACGADYRSNDRLLRAWGAAIFGCAPTLFLGLLWLLEPKVGPGLALISFIFCTLPFLWGVRSILRQPNFIWSRPA